MPSTATITAFYVFARNKPARASQANYNFSNLRGHALPIDPNTATGANLSYDLGSDDNRWRTLYTKKIDVSATTTSSLILECDTQGSFLFKKAGSEVFRITSGGYYVGLNASSMEPTTTATYGGFAASPAINISLTTTTGHISGSTCTITTNGRPVQVGLMAYNGDLVTESKVVIRFNFPVDSTAAGYSNGRTTQFSADISLVRDGTIVSSHRVRTGIRHEYAAYPPSVAELLDFVPAGTYKYSLYVSTISSDSAQFGAIDISNLRMFARES